MPYAIPTSQLVELDVFRATQASMAAFGFSERRQRVRASTNGDVPAWAAVEEVTEYLDAQGATALAGDVYARQVVVADEVTGAVNVGGWLRVGNTRTPEARAALNATYRYTPTYQPDSTVAPGSNMRTPLRLLMVQADGSLLTRPAVGQPDLDPSTGEPLLDGDGNPVLVPAP